MFRDTLVKKDNYRSRDKGDIESWAQLLLHRLVVIASLDDLLESQNGQLLIFRSIDLGGYPIDKLAEGLVLACSYFAIVKSLGAVARSRIKNYFRVFID